MTRQKEFYINILELIFFFDINIRYICFNDERFFTQLTIQTRTTCKLIAILHYNTLLYITTEEKTYVGLSLYCRLKS